MKLLDIPVGLLIAFQTPKRPDGVSSVMLPGADRATLQTNEGK